MKSTFTKLLAVALAAVLWAPALAQQKKPNILVIWGDDIGIHNISAYNLGIMGYRTPNIDRIAREGALFTDAYAQQSCTAGRASFILGQHPFRTGLLTIGMPGSPQGIPDWAPTIADLLKPQGYVTGQFGKNHLGDRDTHLPTVHGFDEFLGNLYHLNAEEEPETYYYPKDPEFRKKYGPRGVLHTWTDGKGGQKIEDTGAAHAGAHGDGRSGDLRRRAEVRRPTPPRTGKPFFVWFNTTRMHVWTHLKKSAAGPHRHRPLSRRHGRARRHGRRGAEAARRSRHRRQHHRRLRHRQRRRDRHLARRRHDAVPRREGHHLGGRLPRADARALAGRDQARHDRQRHLLAGGLAADAAGGGRRAGHRREGRRRATRRTARPGRSHLDGYNFLPYFKGEAKKGPREEIFYFGQGGELNAVRWNDWKVHFAVSNGNIATAIRDVPGWPVIVNLRADPYEKAPHESGLYLRWYADNIWLFVPVQQKLKALPDDAAGVSRSSRAAASTPRASTTTR